MGEGTRIVPLGECALIVKFGDGIDLVTHRRVVELTRSLEENPFPGFQEAVPSYVSVAVYYDPVAIVKTGRLADGAQAQVRSWLTERVSLVEAAADTNGGGMAGTAVDIPVCYCSKCGPDLPFVAEHNKLSPEDVIKIHTSGSYTVYMIGFMPGFPYLGGMAERISAPRLATPRKRVPAGSVGIAGSQTGIYPFASPGGWRLIGRTSMPLFQPELVPPSLLTAGDAIRFKETTHSEMEDGGSL
ncbi:5-oxoprolinase subunit PxpB [Paenibacillus alkalitolerans]|uniref:5-oxoprolinase subunit PxpB n=1 Tax=Paenibacillus alkalitolerans TaxID=2799335 RepID=UPI002D7F9B6F|nr:5-oxoprolinase subunit PxpB [Paenibacillus alkalitolerans]